MKTLKSHKRSSWLIQEDISCPACGDSEVIMDSPIQTTTRAAPTGHHSQFLLDISIRCRTCNKQSIIDIRLTRKDINIEEVKLEQLIENKSG